MKRQPEAELVDTTCSVYNHQTVYTDLSFYSNAGHPEVQLHVLFTTASQVLLKWTVLSRGSSVIQSYVIRYRLSAGSRWIKQLRISPSVTFYLMRDLKSSTTYYVDLRAMNKYFTSEPSVVEVTTQQSGRSASCN